MSVQVLNSSKKHIYTAMYVLGSSDTRKEVLKGGAFLLITEKLLYLAFFLT